MSEWKFIVDPTTVQPDRSSVRAFKGKSAVSVTFEKEVVPNETIEQQHVRLMSRAKLELENILKDWPN